MPNGEFTYATLGDLLAALQGRLDDPGVFVPPAEAVLYIREALRVLNAQTSIWNDDYLMRFSPGSGWVRIDALSDSPRKRTVSDSDIYTVMQAILLEPLTGGVWTGTPMYTIDDLKWALAERIDELTWTAAANMGQMQQQSPVTGVRTWLPDNVLNLHRVRWIQSDTSLWMPYVLGREDIKSRNAFGVGLATQTGEPESWMMTANRPLSFDASCVPDQPGTWDMLVSLAGAALNPPVATPLCLPDDWTWVAQYGALAALWAESPEGRDQFRAKYANERYDRGRKAMMKMPWLLNATVASIPVDTPSVVEMDSYAQNWEQRHPADDPHIVVGGMDFIALAPTPTTDVECVLTVVGRAPIPTEMDDVVQLPRDAVEAVLDYAQHVAFLKNGGSDFALTLPMMYRFDDYCRMKNAQYNALGIFRPSMLMEGERGDDIDPKFEIPAKQDKAATINMQIGQPEARRRRG